MNSSFYSPTSQSDHRRHHHHGPDTLNFGYSGMAYPGGKLFVGCLPYSRCSHDLCEIFSVFGPLVEVALLTTPEGKSKGAAFVTFVNRDDAERALTELQGYTFPNSSRGINISFATKQVRPANPAPRQHTSAPSVISSSSYNEEGEIVPSYLPRSPPGFAKRSSVYIAPQTPERRSSILHRSSIETPELINLSHLTSSPTLGESINPYSILRTNSEINTDLERINEAMIKSLFGDEQSPNAA